jgi:hypothetical protein
MVDVEVPKVDKVRGLVVDDEELVRQAMARVVAATEGLSSWARLPRARSPWWWPRPLGRTSC